MRKLYLLFTFALLTTLQAKGTNYFVSALTGNDSYDGKSVATAFATITKFSYSVNYGPGDTIFVMNGTYSSTAHDVLRISRSGTAAQPIVFKNYPGHTPLINSSTWNAILVVDGASYIVIDGFKIKGQSSTLTQANALNQPGSCANHAGSPDPLYNGNGISVDGRTNGHCHHITIRNNEVYECPGGGISTLQADYITIDKNLAYNNAWYTIYGGSGISILTSYNSDSGTGFKMFITNNIVHHNRLYVPWIGSSTFNVCAITDGNGIIYDTNNNTGTSLSPYTGQVLIENNVSYLNGGRGIHIFQSDNATVRNNTTYQNCQSTEISDGEITAVTANNTKIYNNIMYANPKTGGKISSSSGSNLVSDGNILFGSATYSFFNNNDKFADPLFVDAANANFTLQANSPAIDAGTTVAGQYSSTDILHVVRPRGAKPDIGAYEFTGTAAAGTPFSAGDVVALRVGDGSTSLSTNAAPVSLIEYSPAGSPSGVNIPLTNTSPSRLTVEGASFTVDGQLSLSDDGRYLSAMGYDAAPGSTSATLASTTKVITRLDSKGTTDYTTRIPGTAVNSTSVVSDNGARFWYTGTGGGSATRIANFGTTTGTFVASDQMRSLGIFDGRLYSCALSGSNNTVYYTGVDPAFPTSANKKNYPFPGFPIAGHSYQSFVLLDQDPAVGYSYTYPTNTAQTPTTATINTRFDLLYCSDINLGLVKFYFDGTNWIFAGSYNPSSATGVSGGLYSLTAKINSTGQIVVYAVKGSVSNNNVVKITDASGRTGNISTTVPTSSNVVSAGTNYVFKGIAFSPSPLVTTLPAIASISPASGIAGTVVTITGTSLQGVTAVSFGGVAASSFTEISPNSLTAVVGAGASGTVSVTTANGTATKTGFTYSAPTITLISPTSAATGATVTITGTNLSATSAVSFGGTAAASFANVSATSVTAVVGSGSSGSVSLTTPGGTATRSGFIFNNPATNLDKVNNNILANAAYSLRQLKTAYTHTTITPPTTISGSTNSLTPVVRVRRSADNAQLDIGYTANGDLDTATLKTFVTTGNGYVSIWYDQSGSSYDVAQTNTAQQPALVTNGVVERSGAKPAVRFMNAQKTVLFNSVPASTMFGSGYKGSVFPVMEASGASVYASAFGYGGGNDRWQVHAIAGAYFDVGNPLNRVSVSNSSYAGAIKNYSFLADVAQQQVYVTGTLQASSTATLTPCTQTQFNIGGIPNFDFWHDGHQSEVIVYNSKIASADQQAVEANQEAYYGLLPATIASFSPQQGVAGTAVTIQGTNLTGVTQVTFGGTAAASFTVNSATSITATVAGGATGSVSLASPTGTVSLAGFNYGSALDKVDANVSAQAAYSLRQLKSNYTHTAITAPATVSGSTNSTTPVVRVRRATDNAQLDVGYTANGDLDTATLKTFAATGNAYITIWYDQSGNSYDVNQTNTAQQPALVTNGVVERSGAMPAVRFTNAQKTVLSNSVPAGVIFGSGYMGSVFPVYEASASTVYGSVFGYGSGLDRWQVHGIAGAYFDVGSPLVRISTTDNSLTGNIATYGYIAGTNLQQIYVNGTLKANSATVLTACTQTQFNIGGIPNFDFWHDGHESEVIVYNSALSTSDKQTIQTNQSSYYMPSANAAMAVAMQQPQAMEASVNLPFTSKGGTGNTTYALQKQTITGSFGDIAAIAGQGTGSFTSADLDPINGVSYYKVVATDSKGNQASSAVLRVTIANARGTSVAPNPVANKQVTVTFSKMPQGRYLYTMVSMSGNVVDKRTLLYDGDSPSVVFAAPANVHTGVYVVTISSGDGYKRIEKVVVE